jgi:hypothetical protein
MKKEHHFNIVVKGEFSRKHAERALLVACGWRETGRCEFHLRKSAPKKKGTK